MSVAVDAGLRGALTSRFDVVRQIGRGGMATVYLAHERVANRYVALKVLNEVFQGTQEAERFRRESRLLTTLQHPHILSAFAVGQDGPYDWYSMPFIAGESLHARLKREGRLPIDDALRISMEILDALAYSHAHHVIHRDVKPDNVLLGATGALLADFGIARRVDVAPAESATIATRTGMAIGTPAYMSPEQASADRAIDGRSDQYSVAVLLYECLSGTLPIAGKSPMDFMMRQIMEPPIPLATVAPDVPVAIASAIHRALAKEPVYRFSSATEFRDALADAMAGVPPKQSRQSAVPAIALVDLSFVGPPDQSWIAVGLREAMTAALAGQATMRLIDRSRVRSAGVESLGIGDDAKAIAVAQAVGAKWIAWGMCQCVGDRVRVSLVLAESDHGETWRIRTVDGTANELFAVQDAVVDALVNELSLREVMRSGEPAVVPVSAVGTVGADAVAEEQYLRGLQAASAASQTGNTTAATYFEHALSLAPNHAGALAGMAQVYMGRAIAGDREALPKVLHFADRALALDPQLESALFTKGWALSRTNRAAEAAALVERAVAVNPEVPQTQYLLGMQHMMLAFDFQQWEMLGRAVPPFVRAIALAPKEIAFQIGLATLYLQSGNWEHAEPVLVAGTAVERQEGRQSTFRFIGIRALLGALRRRQGRYAEASVILDEALTAYEQDEFLYAAAFTAQTQCELGRVAECVGEYEVAMARYRAAAGVAEIKKSVLGCRWIKARARFGLARALRHLRLPADAQVALDEAISIAGDRAALGPLFVWEMSPGMLHFEAALTHATWGDVDRSLASLDAAVQWGFGDLRQGFDEPALAPVYQSERGRRLLELVQSRGSLPAVPDGLLGVGSAA